MVTHEFGRDFELPAFQGINDFKVLTTPVGDPAPVLIPTILEKAAQLVLMLNRLQKKGVIGKRCDQFMEFAINAINPDRRFGSSFG